MSHAMSHIVHETVSLHLRIPSCAIFLLSFGWQHLHISCCLLSTRATFLCVFVFSNQASYSSFLQKYYHLVYIQLILSEVLIQHSIRNVSTIFRSNLEPTGLSFNSSFKTIFLNSYLGFNLFFARGSFGILPSTFASLQFLAYTNFYAYVCDIAFCSYLLILFLPFALHTKRKLFQQQPV